MKKILTTLLTLTLLSSCGILNKTPKQPQMKPYYGPRVYEVSNFQKHKEEYKMKVKEPEALRYIELFMKGDTTYTRPGN